MTVHAFVKPEGNRLRVLVRAPLGAMRDIQFPEREGFLDIGRAEPMLRDAVTQWIVPALELFEAGQALPAPSVTATRVSLPSDRSFLSYGDALAHVTGGTLSNDTQLPWPQAQLDVLLEFPVTSERSAFSIRPAFGRLGVEVVTSLRFVHMSADGRGDVVRAFELRGDPGLVRLDPRWHQASWRFVTLGFFHILGGVDHLLFLLLLVIPFRRLRPLVLIATAFTIAHSVALVAAASKLVPEAAWFPPLVETLIAASVLYMAIENLAAQPTARQRGLLAFAFGLVHGFGFSFALTDTLQFAGSHLLASLFSFNLGVELGQLLVLLALVPAAEALFRFVVQERIGTIVVSVLVGHVAWHWMAERWGAFRQFPGPELDQALLVTTLRALFVVVALAAIVWVAGQFRGRAASVSRR